MRRRVPGELRLLCTLVDLHEMPLVPFIGFYEGGLTIWTLGHCPRAWGQ
ncbi:unnamed protein product [Staurois parvus]|uniref:Uncharacterized protein n=1 Tax=Staurois parvus TaxID=386267 RepID=A0ABN9HE15_9NEOB|nr:unnamed protein product [Staurois parvus]